MNILFSLDNNYVQHLGAAIYSLLFTNREFDSIRIFVASNGISDNNLKKITSVVSFFKNAELNIISFESIAQSLKLDMPWPISISAYGRLFLDQIIPRDVDRILYIDCDFIINGSLVALWNYNLDGNCIGAVQDQVTPAIKNAVGIMETDPYFNSGLLLIDMEKWRSNSIGKECIEFIHSLNGRVIHHDQGVLNGIFRGKWTRLPLRYNVMTIHYMMKQSAIRRLTKDYSSFYNEGEVSLSIASPIGVHYTPSFTTRPWQKCCKHPLSFLYDDFLDATPWKGYIKKESHYSIYQRFVNWYFRNLYTIFS